MNKRGFTLIEMVTVLSIMSIIGVIMVNILVTTFRNSAIGKDQNEAKYVVDSICNYFEGQLLYAKKIAINNNGTDPSYLYIISLNALKHTILIEDSDSEYDGATKELFPESYYGRLAISYKVTVVNEYTMSVTISASDSGVLKYARTISIRNLNIPLSGTDHSIEVDDFDVELNNPVISYEK